MAFCQMDALAKVSCCKCANTLINEFPVQCWMILNCLQVKVNMFEYKELMVTFIFLCSGSCLEAGYNSSDVCCTSGHCSGIPAVCSCDLECYERGDCCSDIDESCTEGKSGPKIIYCSFSPSLSQEYQ